jgi:hypothetical protein
MKLVLEPTEHFFMVGDVMVRMWQGFARREDAADEPVVALITAVAFTGQAEALAEGLMSIPPPTPEDAQRWARHIQGQMP